MRPVATAAILTPAPAAKEHALSRHFVVIIAIMLVIAFVFYLTTTLHHDVSWYLVATDRMLAGAKLYRDIIEVNPPLAFYLTIPPVAAARLTGIDAESCFVAYVFLLIALSLHMTDRVLRMSEGARIRRIGMLFAAFTSLVLVPIGVFGQREHLTLILGLPYIFLCSARFGGDRVPPSSGAFIGALAALGFCLKPYFLLVPACFAIYAAIMCRSAFAWLKSETISLCAAVLAYVFLVLTVHPEYLDVIVPYAHLVYDAYSRPLSTVLLRYAVLIVVVSFLLHGLCRASGLVDRRTDPFAIAAIAFLAAYAIQQKGWAYQLVPAMATACLTAAALLVELHVASVIRQTQRRLMLMLAAAALATILVPSVGGGPYRNAYAERLLPDVEKYAAGGAIFAFTSYVSLAFPLVNEANVGWSSRFPTQWLLPGVVRRLSNPTSLQPEAAARLREIERYAVDAVIADLSRAPPDLVIVDKSRGYFGDIDFDFLEYFSHDSRFVQFWQPYTKIEDMMLINRRVEIWRQRPVDSVRR